MFEIAKRIAVEQDKMVIISASLILPFLLRVLGVFGEGFESESAFLFNSNSYSLQKSSAIQYISVTLLISFIEDCFIVICWAFNNKYTKNNSLLALLLKPF